MITIKQTYSKYLNYNSHINKDFDKDFFSQIIKDFVSQHSDWYYNFKVANNTHFKTVDIFSPSQKS